MTVSGSLRLLALALTLAGCASRSTPPSLGFVPTSAVPASTEPVSAGYVIGAQDVLNVTVFQVPDLSLTNVPVDTAGGIQVPLVGRVQAMGLTAAELSASIAARLSPEYVRSPVVNVTVQQAVSQKVTLDGAVTEPGVYELRGATTLLQAVAMAKGPTRTAALTRVVVFRDVEGQRMAALFDVRAIRRGEAEDPQIKGGDIIVVDSSLTSVALREIIAVLPGLAIFQSY